MAKFITRYFSGTVPRIQRVGLNSKSIPFWNNYKDIKIIASLSKSVLELKNKKSSMVNKEVQYIASTVLI